MFFQLVGIRRRAGEFQRIHADHICLGLLKRICLREGINAAPSGGWEMMSAMWADFEVFLQILVEDHFFALRALGPETLGDFPFSGCARADGIFLDRWLHISGRRDSWLHRFQAKRLFGCICHNWH